MLILLLSCALLVATVSAQAPDDVLSNNHEKTERWQVSPTLDSVITDYLNAINQDSIASYMSQLVGFKTRFMLAENRRDIAVWIEQKFSEFGLTDVVIDSFQNTLEYPPRSGQLHTTWQYNVVAALKGTECPDTVFVLGAHDDCFIMGPQVDPYSYSPGANNNASGVAVCLEIARVMAQKSFKPRCTINFVAFGAEEFMTMLSGGHTGSQHYIQRLKESGQTVGLMIDNNQISYRPSNDNWELDFQNCPGSQWVTDLAHGLCEKYTKIVPVDTNDHINYTDAYYFWSAGYPTIFFEEFHFCPHTFTDKDIPENCDPVYCAEVAKISCAMLLYSNHSASTDSEETE
ncbi:MAG: M20/M25/M40 family metallo-hydrolase [Candidatus Zixiibacteriota bacterium]|nr:MAG: M20/M25/M40 family metallo-hydrolase [candidate division Zixibacteria bacterium]